jgi:hypothetical protein
MKNKGNPVPPIEESLKLLKELKLKVLNATFDVDKGLFTQDVKKLFRELENNLKNEVSGRETDKEKPKYEANFININATDDPLEIVNLNTDKSKEYGVEGLPWKLAGSAKDQEVLHYIYQNFDSDIKLGL